MISILMLGWGLMAAPVFADEPASIEQLMDCQRLMNDHIKAAFACFSKVKASDTKRVADETNRLKNVQQDSKLKYVPSRTLLLRKKGQDAKTKIKGARLSALEVVRGKEKGSYELLTRSGRVTCVFLPQGDKDTEDLGGADEACLKVVRTRLQGEGKFLKGIAALLPATPETYAACKAEAQDLEQGAKSCTAEGIEGPAEVVDRFATIMSFGSVPATGTNSTAPDAGAAVDGSKKE